MHTLYRPYRNKITNKLFGVVHMPARGKKKGDALLSYMTGPFTLASWEHFTDPHTSYWECTEIARLLANRGYGVDVIAAADVSFIPRKPYAVCIDVRQNLARLHSLLPPHCKKVMHITSAYGIFQNTAEKRRLRELTYRRGVFMQQQRTEIISDNPAYADFLEGFGNKTIHATYAQFLKPIHPIPISVSREFDESARKDFAGARTHFLWFGGGGAILKGLDLVVEAFAALPRMFLHIIGPAAHESDFVRVYGRELGLPNIKRYPRPRLSPNGDMRCGDVPFLQIADRCAALIYPSASEGTSGAVVQAMHAGLIPIVTREAGLSEDAPAILCDTPSVESIKNLAMRIAHANPDSLREHAHTVWTYARARHTKKSFSEAYSGFLDNAIRI